MYEWDRWLRHTGMPVLVSIAAILVSIAAIVFIVDTIRDDDDSDDRVTLSEVLGEGPGADLLALLGADGLSIDGLGDLENVNGLEDLLGRLGSMLAAPSGYILGVSVSESDEELVIDEVVVGSPADDAGLHAGDIIRRVDGRQVDTEEQLRNALADVDPGDEYRLDIRRADGGDDRVEVRRPAIDATTSEAGRRLRERFADLLEDGFGESLRDRRRPAVQPRIEVFPPRNDPNATPDAALTPAELDAAAERAARELLAGAELDSALVNRLTEQVLARLDPLLQARVHALVEEAQRQQMPADGPTDDADDRPPVAAEDSDVYHGRVAAISDTLITLTGSLGPETVDITPDTVIIGTPTVGGFATVVASNDVASMVIVD